MRSVARMLSLGWIVGACHREPRCGHCDHHDALAAVHVHTALEAGAGLPDTSLYQLQTSFTDQEGRPFALASLQGAPVVMLLFYGTCQAVCPILIGDVLAIENALTPAARAQARFVFVTLDPDTDTVERLRALAAERHLDARATLLRGTADDVRTVATVLGVQYRKIGPGNFTHANLITLLDAQGRTAQQIEGLHAPNGAVVQRIEAMVRGTGGATAAP